MYIVAHNGSPIYGGGEIWIARLLGGLQRRGHRVLLYCKTGVVAERVATHGIETRLRALGGDGMIPQAFGFARTLRRERPDALILTTFKKIWLGGLAAHLARVPFVVARIGVAGLRPRNWTYRYPLRHWIDAVVFNNDALRGPFVETLGAPAGARLVAIWDGVPEPANLGRRSELRRELSLPPDAVLVGSVARLSRQKRLDRFIEAVAHLPERVHGVIAGEGPERAALEQSAAGRKIGGRLHFLGFRDDVDAVLAALDVFVITSDYEGIANAMLEAMAAGLPVVSTDVEGAREALAPSDGTPPGWIVGSQPRDVAAALRALIDQPALRLAMGAAARQRARQRFGFERMVDEWEALLRHLHEEAS